MRMRFLLTLVIQLAVAFFLTRNAQAQTVTNSTVSGTLVSASATIVPPNTSVDVFTTPGAGFFILTQFCTSVAPFAAAPPLTLRGSTFGAIPLASPPCGTYVLGIAIPQGETLSCVSAFPMPEPTHCVVTGVLT